MATGEESTVRLVIPARTRYLRLARLTAAGLAGDLGFGLDDIEDLRVAIDEVCAICIEDAPEGAELTLVYRPGEDCVAVEGSCPHPGPAAEMHPVARELLSMTADDYDLAVADGALRFRLVKRSGASVP